jgi:hypothetical protein
MKTEIIAIIDKSTSMMNLVAETIKGFNSFIDGQKAVEGECNVTTVLFSGREETAYEVLYTALPLASVPEMSTAQYRCGGWTAMFDAIGTSVEAAGQRFASMSEADRPTKVIVLIITDGEENSSRKFNQEQIKATIKHQEDKYAWEFMFLGANIDTVKVGSNLGMKMSNVSNYSADAIGTSIAYDAFSTKSAGLRRGMTANSINLASVVANGGK